MRAIKLQFFMAVLVAALYSDIGSAVTWRRLAGLLKIWCNDGGIKAIPHIVSARQSACLRCPIFYKPLQTCGSPLVKDPELKGLGCSCYMPLKTLLRDSTCWLEDLDGDSQIEYGWKSKRTDNDGEPANPS